MGNDGGSIPTRRELVTLRKKAICHDPTEQNRAKWLNCALKKSSLTGKVAADLLGNLFDKANVLKALVEKSLPAQFSHIESMKDLVDVHFSLSGEKSKDYLVGGVSSENFVSPFVCPITERPVNGKYGFSVVKVCGHAFSEKGLAKSNLQDEQNSCYVCGATYSKADILPLNPDEKQLAFLRIRLEEEKKLQQEQKQQKKEEKKKKRAADEVSGVAAIKKRKAESGSKIRKNRALVPGGVTQTTKEATESHDQKKKASETYQAIFGAPTQPGKYAPNPTGVYRR